MNFFHAALCREGDSYHLMLGGRRLEIAPEKQRRLLSHDVPAQEVTAGIRPEHVLLTEGDGFSGTVEVIEMMGFQHSPPCALWRGGVRHCGTRRR